MYFTSYKQNIPIWYTTHSYRRLYLPHRFNPTIQTEIYNHRLLTAVIPKHIQMSVIFWTNVD